MPKRICNVRSGQKFGTDQFPESWCTPPRPCLTQVGDDFVACYDLVTRLGRKESDRFKSFTYEELAKRDKVDLGIFWLKDEALEDIAHLPDPGVIAATIAADLEAALEQFAAIAEDLKR